MMKGRGNTDINHINIRTTQKLLKTCRHKRDLIFFRAGLCTFAASGADPGYFNLTSPESFVIIKMKLRSEARASIPILILFILKPLSDF